MHNIFDIASIRVLVEKHGNEHEKKVWQTLEAELTQQTDNRQSVPCDRCGQPIPILKGTFVVNKPF